MCSLRRGINNLVHRRRNPIVRGHLTHTKHHLSEEFDILGVGVGIEEHFFQARLVGVVLADEVCRRTEIAFQERCVDGEIVEAAEFASHKRNCCADSDTSFWVFDDARALGKRIPSADAVMSELNDAVGRYGQVFQEQVANHRQEARTA